MGGLVAGAPGHGAGVQQIGVKRVFASPARPAVGAVTRGDRDFDLRAPIICEQPGAVDNGQETPAARGAAESVDAGRHALRDRLARAGRQRLHPQRSRRLAIAARGRVILRPQRRDVILVRRQRARDPLRALERGQRGALVERGDFDRADPPPDMRGDAQGNIGERAIGRGGAMREAQILLLAAANRDLAGVGARTGQQPPGYGFYVLLGKKHAASDVMDAQRSPMGLANMTHGQAKGQHPLARQGKPARNINKNSFETTPFRPN